MFCFKSVIFIYIKKVINKLFLFINMNQLKMLYVIKMYILSTKNLKNIFDSL